MDAHPIPNREISALLKNRLDQSSLYHEAITDALFYRKDSSLKDFFTFPMHEKFLQSIFSPALFHVVSPFMSIMGQSWQIGNDFPETEREARSCFTGLT